MKKSLIILSLLYIGVLFPSCEKNNVTEPDFDVQTDGNTFKAGKEVTFKFTGSAESIVFWSGEKGKVFANKDRIAEKGTSQILQFTTIAGAGTINNSLSVQVSKDFKGVYDAAGIAQASWTDITSRALLSLTTTPAAGAARASGAVNISDFATEEDTPVYVAFRYFSPASTTLAPRSWTVSTFTITNTLSDATVNPVVSSLSNAGFKAVDIKNPLEEWILTPDIIKPTVMKVNGAILADARAENDDWVISAPIKLNTVTAVDYGVSVSSLTTLSPPTSFNYTFTTAGVYKVTFNAFNSNLKASKNVIRELTITITQ